jgi:hypothetical protein
MWPLAIFLALVVGFYWFAFMGTIWMWFNAIFALIKGHFIRAAIWGSLGYGMWLWWMYSELIPDPWDFHEWLKGSAWVVGIGVLATFARFYNRHRGAAQAVPPFEPAPFEPAPSEPAPVTLNININIDPRADSRAVHDDLMALASALRGAIGPRRISGPTTDHGG